MSYHQKSMDLFIESISGQMSYNNNMKTLFDFSDTYKSKQISSSQRQKQSLL